MVYILCMYSMLPFKNKEFYICTYLDILNGYINYEN